MNRGSALHKSCNEVGIGRSSLTSRRDSLAAAQLLQSSITRPTSGHAGTATSGAPAAPVAKRPRLNAIASSSGSLAVRLAESCPVAWKVAGTLRDVVVVQIDITGAAAATPVRVTVTARVALLQVTISRGTADASLKVACVPIARRA